MIGLFVVASLFVVTLASDMAVLNGNDALSIFQPVSLDLNLT